MEDVEWRWTRENGDGTGWDAEILKIVSQSSVCIGDADQFL